jgi:hypothetical protein
MIRRWLRRAAPAVLALALFAPAAGAQDESQQPLRVGPTAGSHERQGSAERTAADVEKPEKNAGFSYIVAAVTAMLVLFLVCAPGRRD